MANEKIGSKITRFLVDYEKDPEQAVKTLTKIGSAEQKDVLAEIACKLKPDAKDAFKSVGITINGAVDKATDAIGNASDAVSDTVSNSAASQLDKAQSGFAAMPDGSKVPSFSF